MSVELVGLWEWLSAAFDRYFSGFRSATGGRHYDLAHDVSLGVLVSGSTVISEVARALRTDDSRPLIQEERRLSEGLSCRGWPDEALADALTRRNAAEMTSRSLLAVDLTDLAKPYGRAMSDIGTVHDGSRHCQCLGYWAVEVFLQAAPHDLVPLRLMPFSLQAQGVHSQTEVVCAVLRRVRNLLPAGRIGVTLEDRGFDGDRYFEFFAEQRWPFIIRLRGERHLTGPWGATRADRLAQEHLEKAPWQDLKRACLLPVGLPDVSGRFFLVGQQHRCYPEPWYFLVYEAGGEPKRSALEYARDYLCRWGGEDCNRLIKQGLGLERFMARSARARARLCLAVELAMSFAAEINRRDTKHVAWIKNLAESFGEEPKSEVSRLLSGIRELAKRTRDVRGRKSAA